MCGVTSQITQGTLSFGTTKWQHGVNLLRERMVPFSSLTSPFVLPLSALRFFAIHCSANCSAFRHTAITCPA